MVGVGVVVGSSVGVAVVVGVSVVVVVKGVMAFSSTQQPFTSQN